MKIKAALLVLLLVLTAGCSFPGKDEANYIRPMELTEREQSLVTLIGAADREILLFEYDVSEPSIWFEVWVEVYEKGELVTDDLTWSAVSDPGAISTDGQVPQPFKGTLAVVVDNTGDETTWTISTEIGEGSRVSSTGNPLPRKEAMSNSRSKIAEPVNVELGEEIILASSVYSDSNTVVAYDVSEYADPENIAKQEHLQLIKCRFGNESARP